METSVLRSGPLRALLAAEVISTTGMQMTWLALPWFVLITTDSPARMTGVMAAELVGFALAGLPAGPLIQRLGSRRTMLAADLVRAPLMLLVPALHWSGHLVYPELVVLALLLGTVGAPYFTAQNVILPELIGEDEATMSKAKALFQAAIRSTMLLGPPLGGVLIGILDAASVLVVDAGTYVVSFLLVVLFVPPSARTSEPDEARGILGGLRFLRREPLLRVWIPLFVVGDAGWQAFFATVPVLTVERFGADAKIAGTLFAAFGAGALLGNFASYRFLAPRIEGLRLIALSVPFQAAPLWLLTLDVGAPVMFGAVLASGIANGICNPSIHAIWTLRIPAAIRPKAMAASGTIWGVGQPLGLLVAGPVLTLFGAEPVLIGFATVQTVCMLGVAAVSLSSSARPLPAGSPSHTVP
ncbi:MAG TPA: MFS transporter [Gaiellaceae bacterium]|jgi:MFS family permease|nr:MFS transporter [Gaiellaceae bacterium]